MRTKLACFFKAAINVIKLLFYNARIANLILSNYLYLEVEVSNNVKKVYITIEE